MRKIPIGFLVVVAFVYASNALAKSPTRAEVKRHQEAYMTAPCPDVENREALVQHFINNGMTDEEASKKARELMSQYEDFVGIRRLVCPLN